MRALRSLGAAWTGSSRAAIEDGYGLAPATVERLAARGTELLSPPTARSPRSTRSPRARAAGIDVVVTDHHAPRADGVLPDAPIVHPGASAATRAPTCARRASRTSSRGALLEAAGLDPAAADEDLDLVALATVADVVPLDDENRALVRAGLRALARRASPACGADGGRARGPERPGRGAIGFRLAPRINAAGRLHRADAGLELLLTGDEARGRGDRRGARRAQPRAARRRDADPVRGRGAGRRERRPAAPAATCSPATTGTRA